MIDNNHIPGQHSDQTVEIGGETITVREFRYRETLEVVGLGRPFLAAMRLMVNKAEGEIEPARAIAAALGSIDKEIGLDHDSLWRLGCEINLKLTQAIEMLDRFDKQAHPAA